MKPFGGEGGFFMSKKDVLVNGIPVEQHFRYGTTAKDLQQIGDGSQRAKIEHSLAAGLGTALYATVVKPMEIAQGIKDALKGTKTTGRRRTG